MESSDNAAVEPGTPAIRLSLAAERESAVLARLRDQVRSYLGERGVREPRIADAVLVLSELLTNALEASPTDGRVEVTVQAGPTSITLDVTNQTGPPTPVPWPASASVEMPGPLAARGRGLPLVAALSARVSIDVADHLTRVSAELQP